MKGRFRGQGCAGERHRVRDDGILEGLGLVRLGGTLVFALCLSVYFRTLQPSVSDLGDSAKFQLVARVLGVPHATGYPFYVVLARLFTLLPVRDVAFRVNLLSAVSAAFAVALLYVLIWMLTRNVVAAVGGALLFAWTKTFWSQAVIAEVYALNAAFVGLVTLLLFLWHLRGKRSMCRRAATVETTWANLTSGLYTFWVKVDSDEVVTESTE